MSAALMGWIWLSPGKGEGEDGMARDEEEGRKRKAEIGFNIAIKVGCAKLASVVMLTSAGSGGSLPRYKSQVGPLLAM